MTTKVQSNTDGSSSILNGVIEAIHIDAAGKVAFPQTPYFVAGQATVTTFTDAVQTKIKFDGEVLDNGGNYDPVQARFTAPVAGMYLFTFSAAQGTGVAGTNPMFGINLQKNGVPSSVVGSASSIMLNNSFLPSCAGSTLIHLNAGDYVEVFGVTLGNTGTPMNTSYNGIFSGQWMGN